MSKRREIFTPISLKKLNHNDIKGIYGGTGDQFAKRMAYLEPGARQGFLELQEACGGIILSDMYRSAISSLNRKYPPRRLPRRGVARPAWSAHNFGLAVDVAVDRTLTKLNLNHKLKLDELMTSFGWYCHRLDAKRGREDWHYNYLASPSAFDYFSKGTKKRTTAGAIENKITFLYCQAWALSDKEAQHHLTFLMLYDGEIDGKIGPKSKAGIRAFQRQWKLKADGIADYKTKRLLWFVIAEQLAFTD